MERKMADTCVDSVLAELSTLEELPLISENSPWADQMVENIESCKSGLRFLKMFFWSLLMLEDTNDVEVRRILMLVNHTREAIWGISRNSLVAPSSLESARLEYGLFILDLQENIQMCKEIIRESCQLLLKYSLRCNSFKMIQIQKFLDVILENLKDLYKNKTDDEIVLLKNQIETLEKKLRLMRDIIWHLDCRIFN